MTPDERIAMLQSEIQGHLTGEDITIALPAVLTTACLISHQAGFSKEDLIKLLDQSHQGLIDALKEQSN